METLVGTPAYVAFLVGGAKHERGRRDGSLVGASSEMVPKNLFGVVDEVSSAARIFFVALFAFFTEILLLARKLHEVVVECGLLDEGAATFVEVLYMEDLLGPTRSHFVVSLRADSILWRERP